MTDHLYINGRYYGYPECCIETFVELFNKHPRSRERHFACKIVGYIPCASCADKILEGTVRVEDLVSEVNSRRNCEKPFIEEKQWTMEEMEKDYKAYVERIKQKEQFKLVLAAIKAHH